MRSKVLVLLSILSHVALIAVIVFGSRIISELHSPSTPVAPNPEPVPVAPTAAAPAAATPVIAAPIATEPEAIQTKEVEPAVVAEEPAKPVKAKPARKSKAKAAATAAKQQSIIAKLVYDEKIKAEAPTETTEQTQEAPPEFIPVKDKSPDGVEAAVDGAVEAAPAKEEPVLDSKPVTVAEDKALPPTPIKENKEDKGTLELVEKPVVEAPEAKPEVAAKAEPVAEEEKAEVVTPAKEEVAPIATDDAEETPVAPAKQKTEVGDNEGN